MACKLFMRMRCAEDTDTEGRGEGVSQDTERATGYICDMIPTAVECRSNSKWCVQSL